MQQPDYSALLQQLRALGFPPSLHRGLSRNTCLGKESFLLRHVEKRGRDTLLFSLLFKSDQGEMYAPCWYEATLRKCPVIPQEVIQNINLTELDNRMSEVNWKLSLNRLDEMMEEVETVSFEREEAVSNIMLQLSDLETSEEGKQWAPLLKWIHWTDTPMESLVEGVQRFRSMNEVTQRYYFFEEEDPFTLCDAYRFLSHRWREKRLLENKVQAPASVNKGAKGDAKILKEQQEVKNNRRGNLPGQVG